uniref:AlNc14C137G7144 protein n=1 Tax=Albugo laibachii Nc14 TaxID=890382 RepID=F0WKV5_9STRA|nr:AlNc14C137G7144 [Albugo laibachii Nc14]|eukprot:CCA21912.1 AlNc14C137G7144 [Albugo laibachii Nc14]
MHKQPNAQIDAHTNQLSWANSISINMKLLVAVHSTIQSCNIEAQQDPPSCRKVQR